MKIFSKIKKANKTYPRLRESTRSGSIYLMQSPCGGVKLTKGHRKDNGYPIGHHAYGWREDQLIDFTGTIEITSTNL